MGVKSRLMTAKKNQPKADRPRAEAKSKEKPLRLVILDSHAIIHRAYHAIPDFSSSKGEPTGALYGLTTMLLKIAADLKPDYIVAARDLPGTTHRHELFEAYKATRMKADDELIAQLKIAPKVFEAFGIPVYSHPGFEADDVVGTIVREVGARSDLETIIATGDMDTLQLVAPRVRVFTLRKGITDTVIYDEEAVHERYGFGPERVVDFKALRGDPSDNIPGIKGIGEKTAAELIKEFGSLEDIYRSLESNAAAFAKKVKPRVVELLKGGKADAAFSKTLATIHANVPIKFELPKRQWHLQEHAKTIMEMCEEFEFKSLKERVRVLTGSPGEAQEVAADEPPVLDEQVVREVAVALWLLHSDITTPTLQDIMRETRTEDFEVARESIFTQLRETGRLNEVYEKIEHPLMPVVDRMNASGVHIDLSHLKDLSREYSKELGVLAGRIYKHAGREFNINSPKQLGVVLYDELKINPARQKKTAGGARTTREEELAKLAPLHPIIGDILAYRELQKLLSTYIDKMPGMIASDGRLHAEFLQAGAATGRMASRNPNLQNIPIKTDLGRRIRTAFAAEKGNVLVALDYSQIELRIAAGLSGDEKLVEIFKTGGDVHAAVAAEVFNVPPEHVDYEMRRRAKVINFGILYGMGVNALRVNLGASVTQQEAATFLLEYFKNFAGLARYIERTKAEAALKGYTETLFGRRRYFPGFQSAMPNLRAQAERMAINAPMQGTQADIIKLAMIEADQLIEKEEWRNNAKLVLQVHDELVYELDEKIAEIAAQKIRTIMESVAPVEKLSGVPILAEASLGNDWGSLKKIPR
jgi:DNA polymerase-1